MKVSYNWLNGKYFDGQLPPPEKVAEELTFHAWEIEAVERMGDDTMLDVKVLPDKAMWALSHRGIAKDLSVILNLPLAHDPLSDVPPLEPKTEAMRIDVRSPNCRRFAAALVKGVKVGPSPEWLKQALETIGQRSINNIVDASNYVMFDLGQPSHAFDATKLPDGIVVRQAQEGEKLIALDLKEYAFTTDDTLISTWGGEALSIAGVKGGQDSGITDATTDIIVEVANWDPVATRKSAARLKLRSDASSRYENGIVPEMVPFGLAAVVDLIIRVAGGELVGYADVAPGRVDNAERVAVSLAKINSVLGVNLRLEDMTPILDRFGWKYEINGETFSITPPFERTDLRIAEDVIEEIGRIYGYDHVAAMTPPPLALSEINTRFYYSELIRAVLLDRGFSEIYTTSFRAHDQVKLANAFAADKGYLRSKLAVNMKEALAKNAPHADLLGLRQIRLFEIGTVFGDEGERYHLALGVQSPSGYKPKADDPVLKDALNAIAAKLAIDIPSVSHDGIAEFDLGGSLNRLERPAAYDPSTEAVTIAYRPFSNYPAIARDIAMWTPLRVSEAEIASLLTETAGDLCVRVTLFDRFEKEGRVSYAFRLVFQSKEKTLTDSEVNAIMDGIYQAVSERGFEAR